MWLGGKLGDGPDQSQSLLQGVSTLRQDTEQGPGNFSGTVQAFSIFRAGSWHGDHLLSVLGGFKGARVNLKSGIVPAGIAAGHLCGPAAHAGIQHILSRVRVSADQVFKQFHRLLSGMQASLAFHLQHLTGIVDNTGLGGFGEGFCFVNAVPVSGQRFSLSVDGLIQDDDALGIVGGEFPVKHTDLLHAAQRLLFGEGETGGHVLYPVPTVAEILLLAADEPGSKGLAGR